MGGRNSMMKMTSTIYLIPLILGFSQIITSTPRLPVSLRFPELGILLEESGGVILRSGFIYIPITVRLPSLKVLTKDYELCKDDWKEFSLLLESIELYLKGTIPKIEEVEESPSVPWMSAKSSRARGKRFIPLLIGGLGMGASIWNRYSISSLKDKVSNLREHLKVAETRLSKLSQSTIKLAHGQDEIVHVVHKLTSALKQATSKFRCAELKHDGFKQLIFSYLVTAMPSFIRGVDAALLGRVTPDLVSPSELRNSILTHKEVETTIYKEHPSLIYELGSFLLDNITNEEPMISGIMILPLAHSVRTGSLLKIISVPVKTPNGLHQHLLPSTAIVDPTRKVVWIPDPLECSSTPGLLVCNALSSYNQINKCLTSLVFGSNSTGCESQQVSNVSGIEASVAASRSGILVSNSITDYRIVKILQGRELSVDSGENRDREKCFILTAADGDYLAVNNHHYPLHPAAEDFYVKSVIIPPTKQKEDPSVQNLDDRLPKKFSMGWY